MADIDFDELDKAVNDLMTNVDASKRPMGLDDPEDTVVTIPESSSAPVTPSMPIPTPAPAPMATVAPAPSAPVSTAASASPSLAVKRRGQFMDIVHPTRDMSGGPKPVSRQGATIQPGIDGIAASAAQQHTVTMSSTPVVMPQNAQQPDEPTTPAQSSWPDPIDMANSTAPATTVAAPVMSDAPDDDTPLTSPFLPDAKPEKRPLGNPLQPEIIESPTPADTPSQTTPVVSDPPIPAVALPEEFSGDLMAVESRDLSSHAEQQAATPDPAPAIALPAPDEQPKLERGEEEPLIPATATPDPIAEPQAQSQQQPEAQPPAGGSIAQQYTEQPSSGDQSNGSIYDTATYHQPIEPAVPAKKKTPTMVWIMVGVGLLLVGAIAGAAYFYFTR